MALLGASIIGSSIAGHAETATAAGWNKAWQQCNINSDCALVLRHPCRLLAVHKKNMGAALNYLTAETTYIKCNKEKKATRSDVSILVCDRTRHCVVNYKPINR
jgi:hypothetical protein